MTMKRKNTENKKKPATKSSKGTGKEFPGYPKYGADEDITRQAERIDENLDDEVLTKVKHSKEPERPKLNPDQGSKDNEPNSKNNFDVTDEDLEALGPKDLSMDMGDDEQLKQRKRPVDFTGEDLDVPGTELDDDQEERGSEDEENNIYSLGGDEKNNLEESQEHEGSL
jgi:hypothetical protein